MPVSWSESAFLSMREFKSIADVPRECLVAPSAFYAPRPGKKPVGRFEDRTFFERSDVSQLLDADAWRALGRKLKPGETPIAHRFLIAVYADWQTK